jgi:hypothetical protein
VTNREPPHAESLRLELQEAIVTFRHQTSIMTQALGYIVAADAILVAYGFSQREAGVLLVASLMPIFNLLIFVEVLKHGAPIAYVAMRLERKLMPGEQALATTYATTLTPIYNYLKATLDNQTDSVYPVIHLPRWCWVKSRITIGLACVFVGQLALFLIGLTVYHYRFM